MTHKLYGSVEQANDFLEKIFYKLMPGIDSNFWQIVSGIKVLDSYSSFVHQLRSYLDRSFAMKKKKRKEKKKDFLGQTRECK